MMARTIDLVIEFRIELPAAGRVENSRLRWFTRSGILQPLDECLVDFVLPRKDGLTVGVDPGAKIA